MGGSSQPDSVLGAVGNTAGRTAVRQGAQYGLDQLLGTELGTDLTAGLTNLIGGLFAPSAGSMAAGIGLPSAGAGLASEGGGFGGAAALGTDLGAALGLEVGAGPLSLIMAPIAIGMMGGMLEGHPNSLFGYRPEGWSHAHAMARTGQQNQSMNLSNALMQSAQDVQGQATPPPLPPNMAHFAQQLAIPKSAENMAMYRALDEGATENRGTWHEQSDNTANALQYLAGAYKDQLDPVTRVGLAQAVNSRLPSGGTPMDVAALTPDQYNGMNWETQLYYNQQHPEDTHVQELLAAQEQARAAREQDARNAMGSGASVG